MILILPLIYPFQNEWIEKLKLAGANFYARVVKGLFLFPFSLELTSLVPQAYEFLVRFAAAA